MDYLFGCPLGRLFGHLFSRPPCVGILVYARVYIPMEERSP